MNDAKLIAELAGRVSDLEIDRQRLWQRVTDLRRSRDRWRARHDALRHGSRFCSSCTKRVSAGA